MSYILFLDMTSYYKKHVRVMTCDFQQCGIFNQKMLRLACAYAQTDLRICLSLEYSMTGNLLNEQKLEFLSLTGGYTGSSESILVKMPHCWKSHVKAQSKYLFISVTSYIYCIAARCLINIVISVHVPLSGHDYVVFFE